MAPQARTLVADVESQSDSVVPTESEATDATDASIEKVDKNLIIVPEDQIPPHPDDIIHKMWYETLVRLRFTLLVFLSLALMLALSLGVAMQMFFSVMVVKTLTFKVVLGIILVPLILLFSAVMVDEMIDFGLDAMDLPCFGLFRASVTSSVRSRFPSWNTRKTEIGLIILLEGLPILTGLISLPTRQGNLTWYTRFLMSYILGAVLCVYLMALLYVISHIHVGHSPLTEARMNVLWHNMGNLGDLKHVLHDVVEVADADQRRVRWLKCSSFMLAAVGVEVLVLLVFIFWKNFAFMFSGLMLTTIFMALALTAYAPRLLGKAFWLTLAFFVVLTLGLTFGTTATIPTKNTFIPTALGPGASGFGANLTEDNGLPLQFLQRPFGAKSPGYPICGMSWGNGNATGYENQLNIFDLAMLTKASYAPQGITESALGEMLNGTELEKFEVLENQPDSQIGRLVVVDLPKQKLRVMAVRGTAITEDAYADLEIYCAIAVLQFFGHVVPVLKAMPTGMVQTLLESSPARAIFDATTYAFLAKVQADAEVHKKQAAEKGFELLITGHSLGGAIAGVIATKLDVAGLGISAPGLRYQLDRMGVMESNLQHSFTVIQPTNDIVPKIDEQRGMVEWIKCDLQPIKCHSLVKTTCELWSQCGDPRGRDYRRLCSTWYSKDDMNM